MLADEVYGALKNYINETLVGMGALKGAPCQIQSITENPTGVWNITFLWEDSEGDTHTSLLVLHDGAAASNYEALSNLPHINNVELVGNKSLSDLGFGDAATAGTTSSITESSADLLTSGGAFTALGGKVDKEAGKGLSTNDFTDSLKDKLDGVESGADVNIVESVKLNGTALTPDANKAVDVEAVETISVNGTAQTVTSGAVDLDVAANLITDAQWSALGTLWAVT